MNNCFILLAAGSGNRFKSKIPKQFTFYKGKRMYEHSIDKAIESKIFKNIILVIQKSHFRFVSKHKKVKIVVGGLNRHVSSKNALNFIKKFNPRNVFIHDAARPSFSIKLLKNLNQNLKKFNTVVPYILPNDSIKYKKNKTYNLEKKKIKIMQTPQCFNFKYIHKLSNINKRKIEDECTLSIENGDIIKFVKGEENNIKITNLKDIQPNEIKYGLGFDVHRLKKGKKLFLGGLMVKSKYGTLGHSDGDPVLHSITDAILGACGMNDIGQKFSNKNKKFKNIRSTILLKEVINEINSKKFFINNIDVNIICETPKISPLKRKLIKTISKLCNIGEEKINIKGKTTEKLGIIGKEKAIACETIASVIKYV